MPFVYIDKQRWNKVKQFYSTHRAAREMIQSAIDDELTFTEVFKRRADRKDDLAVCPGKE